MQLSGQDFQLPERSVTMRLREHRLHADAGFIHLPSFAGQPSRVRQLLKRRHQFLGLKSAEA
jgi:hypothetical protein